jgi:hypothetical protein
MELVGRCPAEIRDFQSEISNPQSAIYFDASASLTKSTAGPRIARVCFVSLAGSKLTRTDPRCQVGAGHAESGSASSGMLPARVFFSTGLRRLSCATTAEIFLAVVGHAAIRDIVPVPAGGGIGAVKLRRPSRKQTRHKLSRRCSELGHANVHSYKECYDTPVAAPPQMPYLKYYSDAIRNHEFLSPLA